MAAVSFRGQQLLVSVIGALLLLPLDLFMGGLFSFSFGTHDSVWAWAFGLTAFWGQTICILASFFKPRTAAACMLVNIAISFCIWAGSAMPHAASLSFAHLNGADWRQYAPNFMTTASLFWTAPLIFALLLLRRDYSEQRHAEAIPVAKM